MERILIHKSGKTFLQDSEKDFHTQWGVVKAPLKKGLLTSNHDEEFLCCDPFQFDKLAHLKRRAQVILPKDAASIIAETGIDKNSVVGDAGSGSGWLACFLGSISKTVHTYEVREDHMKVVEKNIATLQLKNVSTHLHDITESIKEKDFDVFVLDMPTPWDVLKTMESALKPGGFLVVYVPHITQTQQLVNSLPESFIHVKTFETVQREWMVEGKKARPVTQQMHTGFISICRKIK